MGLEEVHACKESEDKIVCISMNMFGNTFCGYCGKQVDYKRYYLKKYDKEPEDLKDGTLSLKELIAKSERKNDRPKFKKQNKFTSS
jgi:hypothetical protein